MVFLTAGLDFGIECDTVVASVVGPSFAKKLWRASGEEVQKERRASRVREAALCIDTMKTRSQESEAGSQKAKNAVGGTLTAATGTVAVPETEWKGGPRREGKWACVGASGREWSIPHSSARLDAPKTALAHLGPPPPTSFFPSGGEIHRGDTETQRWVRNYAEKITVLSHRFTTFRILSYTGGPYYRIFSLFIERSLF